MEKRKIITYALANASFTILYVILIALFMSSAQMLFGDGKTPLIPIAMLLLFVFSAGLCGILVFGRPIMWYLDGNKKEALALLGYTMLSFLVTIIGVLFVLYLVNNSV